MKITRNKKAVECSSGSIDDMLDAFENRIDQLENIDDVELSTDIEANSTSMDPRYKVCDTWGAPQAGCDEEYFDDWYEVEEYIDETDGLADRIADGYAWVEDLTDSQIEKEMDYRKGNKDALEECDNIMSDSEIEDPAQKYADYEDFVKDIFPGYEEEILDEIDAVWGELRKYNARLVDCPVYWRDDYEDPIIQIGDQFYFVTTRGTEARFSDVTHPAFGDSYLHLGLPISED